MTVKKEKKNGNWIDVWRKLEENCKIEKQDFFTQQGQTIIAVYLSMIFFFFEKYWKYKQIFQENEQKSWKMSKKISEKWAKSELNII